MLFHTLHAKLNAWIHDTVRVTSDQYTPLFLHDVIILTLAVRLWWMATSSVFAINCCRLSVCMHAWQSTHTIYKIVTSDVNT